MYFKMNYHICNKILKYLSTPIKCHTVSQRIVIKVKFQVNKFIEIKSNILSNWFYKEINVLQE